MRYYSFFLPFFIFRKSNQAPKNAENSHVNRNVKQNVRGSWWKQPGIFSTIYGVIKGKEHQIMDMISLHNIQKSYGSHQVLKNVDLTVRQGEIYGLIGKNGAGKTTIFKIILGLTEFENGRLSIAGKSIKSDIDSGRKKIGFFIGKNFFGYLTAKENLEYYRQMKGIRDKNEAERVLKLVGLDKADSKFASFSMGMKQRLGIANAMLGNPEILILDEPVNGLDPQGIADIRNLLTEMNREYGTTIIVSSHILGELEHTATRFGIIDQGHVLREITFEDLKIPNDTIQLRVSDCAKAKRILSENGISILQESSEYKSLEDYYFELVGGNIHD